MSTPATLAIVERTPKRETAIAHVDNGESPFMSMISRAAADPDFDPVKMQQLVGLRNDEIKRLAEEAFNEAMSECQAEMRPVAADAENDQTRSKYATYGAIDKALRPIYTRHGFAISYDETDSPKADHTRILAYVSRGGFTRTYRKDMPITTTGPKGGAVMTPTHATGSATSYGKRYLLSGIFNVAIGQDDDDGNGANSYERITDSQVATLVALLQEVGASQSSLLSWLKLERLSDIAAAHYSRVVKAVEEKRKAPATKTAQVRR